MRNTFIIAGLVLTSPLLAPAQSPTVPEPNMNRFSIGYRMGLNITADFRKLGNYTPPGGVGAGAGPATGGNTDRTYDDGYVKRDTRTNALGLTWNWGYDNASQVPGNDTIQFHSVSSVGSASSKNNEDDPQHGFEFLYQRRIREIGKKGWWGLEAGVGFENLTLEDHRPLAGKVSLLTDTYQLGGVIPPTPPPYRGDYTNAGPLIGDDPTRTIQSTGGATILGRRSVDADLITLRFGPFFEIPLSEKLSFFLSGGLALANVDCDFKFTETVNPGSGGSITRSGHSNGNGWLVGGYAAGMLLWRFNETWDMFGGAQFQTSDSYTQSANGKKVDINMGEAILVSFGIGASFK